MYSEFSNSSLKMFYSFHCVSWKNPMISDTYPPSSCYSFRKLGKIKCCEFYSIYSQHRSSSFLHHTFLKSVPLSLYYSLASLFYLFRLHLLCCLSFSLSLALSLIVSSSCCLYWLFLTKWFCFVLLLFHWYHWLR